jgi:hypothetical protein
MLTPEQRKLLDQIPLVDIITHFGVQRILSYIDPLHAIVVFGLDEIFRALERYDKHKE